MRQHLFSKIFFKNMVDDANRVCIVQSMSRTYFSGKTKRLLKKAMCFDNVSASCILGVVYVNLYNPDKDWFPYLMTGEQCRDFNNKLINLSEEKWTKILKEVHGHFSEHTTDEEARKWILTVSKYLSRLKNGYICE
jgi:hypothetical protein